LKSDNSLQYSTNCGHETEIIQHVFKIVVYLFLLPEYTKYLFRNLEISTLFYLHFGSRLQICVQTWQMKFAVASLCYNLQSMFNQHVRPHHT